MSKRLFLVLALATLATVPSLARAQAPRSIDDVLTGAVASPALSATDQAALDPAGEGVICRVMTDLAHRNRRERVCMSHERWAVLVAAAHRPAPPTFRLSAIGSQARAR